MRNKIFFGAVIFFLFGLFVIYFGVVQPRFVGLVMRSSGVVAVSEVERIVPAVLVPVVDQDVLVDVPETVEV